MTALDHRNVAIAAGRTPGAAWARRVAELVMRIRRLFRNRAAMRHLSELSDHELADIGLTRDDLRIVGRLPVATDPTVRLSELAAARLRPEDAARRVN